MQHWPASEHLLPPICISENRARNLSSMARDYASVKIAAILSDLLSVLQRPPYLKGTAASIGGPRDRVRCAYEGGWLPSDHLWAALHSADDHAFERSRGRLSSLALSPDGTTLAYDAVSPDYSIWIDVRPFSGRKGTRVP